MSDSLTVFGTDYTGVTGIKAKQTGGSNLTYIRPTGTKSISENGTGIDVAAYSLVDVAVSGGNGDSYTLTTVLAQRTLNPDSQHWVEVPASDWIEAPAVGEYYLVTFDGTEYLCTGGSMWDNEVVFGDDNNLFQNSNYMVPFAVDYSISQQECIIGCVDTNQHTIKIEHFEFVDGPLNLITKSITSNGTYSASSDNADGYSSVTVNVPSSGGTDFIVDFEYNSSTQMWEPTCTYAEIAQAVSDGKHIGGEIESPDNATVNCKWDDVNDKFYYEVIHMEDSTTGTWQIYNLLNSIEKTWDVSLLHPYGNKAITENGTGIDVARYATVNVNVPSGSSMNVQTAQSTTRVANTVYTKTASLTCSTSGTYDVYWDCFRSSTSGTSGSQLYIGGSAYGSANTTFSNHAQNNHLTGVHINANQEVAIYVRSRATNYYAYCGQLTIVQTA